MSFGFVPARRQRYIGDRLNRLSPMSVVRGSDLVRVSTHTITACFQCFFTTEIRQTEPDIIPLVTASQVSNAHLHILECNPTTVSAATPLTPNSLVHGFPHPSLPQTHPSIWHSGRTNVLEVVLTSPKARATHLLYPPLRFPLYIARFNTFSHLISVSSGVGSLAWTG